MTTARPDQSETDHAGLMDAIYRRQRLIYDVTRKYYLLGRDQLISDLTPPEGGTVLEIACGTGRNLSRISARWPERRLCGLDISDEMLTSARSKLGNKADLAQADACDFNPEALFGVAQFDRIVLSYSLSMIPDWQGAVREAVRHLAPGGSLHIVDFGTQAKLPTWFRRALRAWLAKFHVSPRDDLSVALQSITAGRPDLTYEAQSLYREYARLEVLRRTDAGCAVGDVQD
ncbi:MAG: class I SAM-dependent methyltransferase [Paracoccaceae bacterium]